MIGPRPLLLLPSLSLVMTVASLVPRASATAMGMAIQPRNCPACSGGSSTDTPVVIDRMDMPGMDMPSDGTSGSSSGPDCKISMLWNWSTKDACFISASWQITSDGMFAGSCIGVILLVMTLEALRRAVKEYDRYLIRNHVRAFAATAAAAATTAGGGGGGKGGAPYGSVASTVTANANNEGVGNDSGTPNGAAATVLVPTVPPFRPTLLQQALRALLHMLQFAVAYFIMLMAMYYNGFILICIFIGAFLGSFLFQWETMIPGQSRTSAANEATVCCG